MKRILPWSGVVVALAVLAGCGTEPNTAVPTTSVQTPPSAVAAAPTLAIAVPTSAPVAASTVPAAPTSAPAEPYNDRTDAVSLLASFYNAVNLKNYTRAYGYWRNPPQSAEQFAQGYATTANVQVIVRPPDFYDAGAGNVYTSVPAAVLATHTDGSMQLFTGCYTLHRSNLGADAGPQGNDWDISQASIAAAPANADAVALLSQPCDPANPSPAGAFNTRDSAADLLASYYNAINLKDYTRAYGYWRNPPQSAEQFAQGYANTAKATVLIRPSELYDAGAGNVRTQVPALVVATQTDGSTQLFAGCYTLHRSNLGADAGPQGNAWDIESASLAQAPATANAIALLPQACTP